MHWCSREGIPPRAVDDRVTAAYFQDLALRSFNRKPRTVYRRVCQLWNKGHGEVPDWPTDFFYEHYFRAPWRKTNKGNIPRSVGVRGERWKYVHYFDEKPPYEQLFDLKNDPHEVDNLASNRTHHETLEVMRRRMEVLQAKVGPPWKPGR